MKRILIVPFIAAAIIGCCNNKVEPRAKEIGRMPATESGYQKGVSAMYAATYNNVLYIAGGCNFPTTPAADGGSKRYYKGIYKSSLKNGSLQWSIAGELPQCSAYGAQAQKGNKWYIAGGMNESGALKNVYCITIEESGLTTDTLPSLPHAIDNTAGCIVGDSLLCVVGGNADGKPSAQILSLNLNDTASGWQVTATMPAPRVQPVCAATGGKLYVWGGFCPGDTATAKVYTDGVRYDTEKHCCCSCSPIADVYIDGETITLSGGTATTANGIIYATGGVNKEIFFDAITGSYKLIDKKDYMLQEPAWYKFNSKLLMFNPATEEWQFVCDEQPFARAGALLIEHNNTLIYIGGELKPGIRTPQIHIAKAAD